MPGEQYDKIQRTIPTFTFYIPELSPSCLNCCYFSQKFPDGYNGLRGLSHCSKYDFFLGESADGLDSYKCDDHKFSE